MPDMPSQTERVVTKLVVLYWHPEPLSLNPLKHRYRFECTLNGKGTTLAWMRIDGVLAKDGLPPFKNLAQKKLFKELLRLELKSQTGFEVKPLGKSANNIVEGL